MIYVINLFILYFIQYLIMEKIIKAVKGLKLRKFGKL